MKILEREIGLREETRAAEQAREVLTREDYVAQARPLAETQRQLRQRVGAVTEQIRELPKAEEAFRVELAILSRVQDVMKEATLLLAIPQTGPGTIAAETEAIELLLQTKRINPKGGGGGGGSSPGGGGTGDTQEAALALIGSGSESNAQPGTRDVEMATGNTGRQLPVEFRSGLDAYFSNLETTGSTTPNRE
jgi:hypothetical protein